MGRSPLDKGTQEQIVLLAAQGKSLREVWETVRDTDDASGLPNRSTVYRYMKRWDKLPEHVKERERPFQSHEMSNLGIPVEASKWVLDMLYFAGMTSADGPLGRWLPTRRQVKWWWRIHNACPEIEQRPLTKWPDGRLDLVLLAQRFATRELFHDLLKGENEPIDLSDLEALLIYRPWLADSETVETELLDLQDVGDDPYSRHQNYHRDVGLGIVPKLRRIHGMQESWVGMLAASPYLLAWAEGIVDDHPELLFSQQIAEVNRWADEQEVPEGQEIYISLEPGFRFGQALIIPQGANLQG